MSVLDEIKANTCPYCGGRYTIADRGCANTCSDMQRHQKLLQDALAAEVREDEEWQSRK